LALECRIYRRKMGAILTSFWGVSIPVSMVACAGDEMGDLDLIYKYLGV